MCVRVRGVTEMVELFAGRRIPLPRGVETAAVVWRMVRSRGAAEPVVPSRGER